MIQTLQERANALLAQAKAHGLRWYPHERDAELRHTYTMAWLDGYYAAQNQEALERLKEAV